MGGDRVSQIYQNAGSASKALVKAGYMEVSSILVTNTNAAARFFQLHDEASDPDAADVPKFWVPVPAGTAAQPTVLELTEEFFADRLLFKLGLGWAWSTTAATFTDSATAAEHTVTIVYRHA